MIKSLGIILSKCSDAMIIMYLAKKSHDYYVYLLLYSYSNHNIYDGNIL